MNFKGNYTIPAALEDVWAALHEPAVLASSIPGCESVEKLSETEFMARAMVRIGPVKARFEGKVSIEECDPPPGVTRAMILKGEGQGGAAGFARGESSVFLVREGETTVLSYDVTAMVGGRIAQVGQRLIDGAAKAIADEFFAKFAAGMQLRAAAPPPPPPLPVETAAPPRASVEEGLAPQIWVVGLIGIIVILLIGFSLVFKG